MMMTREDQLLHEIENKEISPTEAIETILDIRAYGLLPDVITYLELDKAERDFFIANLDKANSARYVSIMLDILEDEDEIEEFIKVTIDNGHEKALVGMSIVNEKLNRNLFKPIIFSKIQRWQL